MNASRPEAETEYSSPPGGSAGRSGARERRIAGRPDAASMLALVGAALLLCAELEPLLAVRTIAADPRLVRSVQTGPHHAWALVPIAVAAVLLAALRGRAGGRAALGGLALLGLAALGVAIGVDLPSAHAVGVVGTPVRGLHEAQAHAAIGLYLETLGGVVLLVAAAAGALVPRQATRAGTSGSAS